ncbi:hypothetical protein CLOP_g16802 [Closterium sp. NIES-67]|nr:hypothetical protein CLOP_g16802 [Closterium sp. NIES-67]
MRPLVYAILLLVVLGTLDAALARPKRARPKRASPAVFMDGRRWYPHPHTFRPKRASLAHPLLDQREPSPRRFRPKRASPMRLFYGPDNEFANSRRFRPKRASLAHSAPRMLRGGGSSGLRQDKPGTGYHYAVDPNYYYQNPYWYTPSYWTDVHGGYYDYGNDVPYYGGYYVNPNTDWADYGDWFDSGNAGYGDYGSGYKGQQ